jgi:hypothetical protein
MDNGVLLETKTLVQLICHYMPPSAPYAPTKSYFAPPPKKSPFFLNLYKQTSEG